MPQAQAQTKDPESATAPAPPLLSIPLYFRLYSPENWKLASLQPAERSSNRQIECTGRQTRLYELCNGRREERDALTRVCLFSANATQMGAYKVPASLFPSPTTENTTFGVNTSHRTRGGTRRCRAQTSTFLLGAERVFLAAGAGPVSG